MTYLPDNRGQEKGEAPMHKNLEFLNLEMDFSAKKMTAHDVYFVIRGVQDLFPALVVSVQP